MAPEQMREALEAAGYQPPRRFPEKKPTPAPKPSKKVRAANSAAISAVARATHKEQG